MDKSPLIEIAEYHDGIAARNAQTHPKHAALETRNAKILRAAAAVIDATRNLQRGVTEKETAWTTKIDFALDALAEFDAACKEILR